MYFVNPNFAVFVFYIYGLCHKYHEYWGMFITSTESYHVPLYSCVFSQLWYEYDFVLMHHLPGPEGQNKKSIQHKMYFRLMEYVYNNLQPTACELNLQSMKNKEVVSFSFRLKQKIKNNLYTNICPGLCNSFFQGRIQGSSVYCNVMIHWNIPLSSFLN